MGLCILHNSRVLSLLDYLKLRLEPITGVPFSLDIADIYIYSFTEIV